MDDKRKLTQGIFNPVSDSVQKLAQLFPSAVKDGEVDLNALKEELGQFTPVGAEKYELNWAGKATAKRIAREDVLGRTLKYVPKDSKDADTTENLYIEGDNLEVLKLLRQNYYGAIKMIYIDPPYNTGNDFVYRDNFAMSEEESAEAEGETEDGVRMIVNQKSTNRYHANWLNMMYPRLKVVKDLLTEDGVIFISIDESEYANLRKMCDEVFGELNFAGEIVWKNSSKNDQAYISIQHEYFLFYVKNKDVNLGKWNEKKEGLDEIFKAFEGFRQKHGDDWNAIHKEALSWYAQFNESNPIYSSKHYSWMDERGVYFPADISGPNYGQYRYDVIHPVTGKVCKQPASGWRYPPETMKQRIQEGFVHFGENETTVPNNKTYLMNTKEQSLTSIKYRDGRVASKALTALMGVNCFSNPKDVDLLSTLISAVGLEDGDIVLDFFSGSGTTAEVVMNHNAENQTNCKFILVQIKENLDNSLENAAGGSKAVIKNAIQLLDELNKPHFITELGKERIRRAGEKIKADIEEQNAQLKLGEDPKQVPDIGFKVFRTADTNIRWTHEALKSGAITIDESMLSEKDKLDFMPGFKDIDVVYEVLLRQRDVPLSAKVECRNEIGKRTYLIADAYLVCLEESITKDMLEKLAAVEPLPIKYILRDSAFEDNISLKDETIRRLEALIARNAGEQERTYTVEFI